MMGKKLLRCIGGEFKKYCYLPYLCLAILAIVFLCLTAEGEIDSAGKSVTIFSLMLQSGKTTYAQDIFKSALFLWNAGIGDWLVVFIPFFISFGYITILSGERQNGQVRFHLIRSGRSCYYISKVIGGALYGGMVFVIGYALFGILMAVVFPSLSSFSVEDQAWCLEMYFGNNVALYIVKRLIGSFLYGMAVSTFGIGVAIIFRDKYMLLCLPFLLNYIYRQIFGKMMAERFANGADSTRWLESFYPESIIQISTDRYWMFTFIFMLAVYTGLTICFCLDVRRKCGD
jgi:hypothetical protein